MWAQKKRPLGAALTDDRCHTRIQCVHLSVRAKFWASVMALGFAGMVTHARCAAPADEVMLVKMRVIKVAPTWSDADGNSRFRRFQPVCQQELVLEELSQSGGLAPRRAPHDRLAWWSTTVVRYRCPRRRHIYPTPIAARPSTGQVRGVADLQGRRSPRGGVPDVAGMTAAALRGVAEYHERSAAGIAHLHLAGRLQRSRMDPWLLRSTPQIHRRRVFSSRT